MRVVLFACLVWQGQNYHVLIIQRNSHWKTVLPISCATLARICENIFPHTSDRFAFFADRTKGWNWSWECSIVVTQAWPAINHSSNIIQSMKQLKNGSNQPIHWGGGGVPLCTFVYLSHCVPRPLCISLKLRVHISSAKEVLTTPQNGNIESTKAWFLLVLCSSSAVHVVVWNFITVPWNGSCQRHSEQSHFVCAWLLQSPLLHRYHTATAPPI